MKCGKLWGAIRHCEDALYEKALRDNLLLGLRVTRERPKRDFYRNAETRRNRNLTTETEIAETETTPKLSFHMLEILALKRRFTFATKCQKPHTL